MLNQVLNRYIRRLYWLRDRNPISEELRGWTWDRPPVKPRGYFGLGVSEVAYKYCEVYRDLWLRRKQGIKPRVSLDSPLGKGLVVHKLMEYAVEDAKDIASLDVVWEKELHRIPAIARRRVREITGTVDTKLVDFYTTMLLVFAMQSLSSVIMHGGIGSGSSLPLTEYIVDGTPLGLSSRLRIDAISEMGLIIEYKYGSNNVARHALGLAGYALALESDTELPVDFGAIIYILRIDRIPKIKIEPVYIDNELRRSFLDNRDDAIETLMQPRPPPPLHECNRNCPFYPYCHPEEKPARVKQ